MVTSNFWALFHVDCLRALTRGAGAQNAIDLLVGLHYLLVLKFFDGIFRQESGQADVFTLNDDSG